MLLDACESEIVELAGNVCRSLADEYKGRWFLPGNHLEDHYILPVSGGVDSSVLAILLHALFPEIPFKLVFTDTGAEEDAAYKSLSRLEAYLGKSITRIQPERTLFDLIDHYNGFLPSPRDRWCTRELKLIPFRKWMAQLAGVQKWMFVGIRADEDFRIAFTIDECETVMPFVDLGITRTKVFEIASKTIGIPKTYESRTRSGCGVCPYQRKSEIVGLLQRSPQEFERGERYEKLSIKDAERHSPGVELWKDTSIASNWHSLPVPLSEDEIQRGAIKKAKAPDLFGARVFIGGEFFMDGMIQHDEFIWHQRVVCYSSTLAGVKKQLDGRYQHLLSTAEVYEMSQNDLRNKARFAIWYIELPTDVFDPEGISEGESYTWHQGTSYRQIRHIVEWSTRALHAEFQRREAAKVAHLLTVQYEWSETSREALRQATAPCGDVLLSQWYKPSELVPEPESEEEVLRLMPCPMCQL